MAQSKGTSGAPQPNGVHVENTQQSAILHRQLRHKFLNIARGEGHYLVLDDGRKIFDASGGAAVACVGVSGLILSGLGSSRKMLPPFRPRFLYYDDPLTRYQSMAMPR